MLSQTGGHVALPHHGLKVVAWASIFYKDIEVMVITATRDRGRDCQKTTKKKIMSVQIVQFELFKSL